MRFDVSVNQGDNVATGHRGSVLQASDVERTTYTMAGTLRLESTLNRYKSVNARSSSERNSKRADGGPKRVQPRVQSVDAITRQGQDYEALLGRLRALQALVDATDADIQMRQVKSVRDGWENDEEPARPPMNSWDEDYATPKGRMRLLSGYKTPEPKSEYLTALAVRLQTMKDVWLMADIDLQSKGWRPEYQDVNQEKRGRGTTANRDANRRLMERAKNGERAESEPDTVSPIRKAFPDFFTPVERVKPGPKKPRGKPRDDFDLLFDQILGRFGKG